MITAGEMPQASGAGKLCGPDLVTLDERSDRLDHLVATGRKID